jgi:YidC/Oxa1 family membrane protein insertase
MSFLDWILWPIKWVVEVVLVSFYNILTTIGLDPNSGIIWMLAIACLVILIRGLMIPLAMKQYRTQKKLVLLAPQLVAVQDKYKGKTDQFSREEMARETLAVYKNNKVSPLFFSFSLIIQIPIFASLFTVLNTAINQQQGVSLFTKNLATKFYNATFFNTSLHDNFWGGLGTDSNIIVIVPIMVIIMVAAQLLTHRLNTQKQVEDIEEANPKNKKAADIVLQRTQTFIPYFFAVLTVVTGLTVPLALLAYLFTSTLWSLGQQFINLRIKL